MRQINFSNNKVRLFTGIAVFLVIIGLSFWTGYFLSEQSKSFSRLKSGADSVQNNQSLELEENFDYELFHQVWQTVQSQYVHEDELSGEEMFYGSLKGMVEAVGDPYTMFLKPAEAKEFQEDLSGTFEGIGAEIGIRDDVITVISPLDGRPADKAGLRAGDKIVRVDDKITSGMTVFEAVKLIRGPKGTEVTLTVIREEEDDPLEITIERGIIDVESVNTSTTDDNIYIIRVSNFADDTIRLFNQAVNEILLNEPKGIVLDLRNNPGGYLQTAVKLAGKWVNGSPVVYEKSGDGQKTPFTVDDQAKLMDYRTVVLVNGGSASASEILAGALQDYERAVVVGTQTYGKGSVQTLQTLPDGSAIKVTSGTWLTPEGRNIDEQGITPDIEVELDREKLNQDDTDNQRQKAFEIINNPEQYEQILYSQAKDE